jgi:NAD(P)-dependent dehydrogenase (short-subunit alcohol dehydrogenase family)
MKHDQLRVALVHRAVVEGYHRLVNAAGMEGFKRFANLSFDAWSRVVDVNLRPSSNWAIAQCQALAIARVPNGRAAVSIRRTGDECRRDARVARHRAHGSGPRLFHAVSFNGVFHTISVVLGRHGGSRLGRIVNISSSSTHSGQPFMSHYVAAKPQ